MKVLAFLIFTCLIIVHTVYMLCMCTGIWQRQQALRQKCVWYQHLFWRLFYLFKFLWKCCNQLHINHHCVVWHDRPSVNKTKQEQIPILVKSSSLSKNKDACWTFIRGDEDFLNFSRKHKHSASSADKLPGQDKDYRYISSPYWLPLNCTELILILFPQSCLVVAVLAELNVTRARWSINRFRIWAAWLHVKENSCAFSWSGVGVDVFTYALLKITVKQVLLTPFRLLKVIQSRGRMLFPGRSDVCQRMGQTCRHSSVV